MKVKKYGFKAKIRTGILLFLIISTIIDNCIYLTPLTHKTYVTKFFRILTVLVYIRPLREQWMRIMVVVYDSSDILILMGVYILFSSYLAFILFEDISAGLA